MRQSLERRDEEAVAAGFQGVVSMPPAPGRACGTCTLCCKVFQIPELEKPAGAWCRHCTQGAGCGIHPDRPAQCRAFFCLWMTDATMPAEWKPERSKMVLSIFPANGFIYVQVDPGFPQAWRKAPYYDQLRRWAKDLVEKGRHIIAFVNDSATLIMPEKAIPLGKMTASDRFMVRKGYGANGVTYSVERGQT